MTGSTSKAIDHALRTMRKFAKEQRKIEKEQQDATHAARAQRQSREIGDGQGVRSLAEHVEALLARAGIDPPPEIIWPAEFLNMPEPERDWLLDGVLPLGGLNLLTASPNVGKSTFARCLAVAVAQGRQFLGRKVARGTVLIVSLEDSDRSTYRHFRDIGLADEDPVGMIRLAALPDQYHARLHFLERRIAANKATLVILDTVSKFLRIADSNAYAAVSNALDPLLQVARRTGACILATHHSRKSGGQDGAETLGSTAFFGACDTHICTWSHGVLPG
ncbi:MAG: AAA family ATPase, partial [Rhodospirillaceae bacterium]|nr:AAA family ATPase [Rhodospirillaceae bacterium]